MEIEMLRVRGINVANIHSSSDIVFFGICALAGSNYEIPNVSGISHFCEHLAFKQTSTRNWKQINEEFAMLGAPSNAFTSNNEVMYHANCPKENTEKTISLLLDMFFNSTFPNKEIEKERNVILEEKKMYEDNPQASFSMAIGDKMFSWNIGHETLGTVETIKSISRKQMMQYLKDKINLDNFIFVCSGNVKSEDLKRYIEKNIPDRHDYLKEGKGLHSLDTSNFWRKEVLDCTNKIKFTVERENITQSNAYMMFDALPANHPLYYAESILYEGLGGGSFSLLFSKIREKLGLCYSVGLYADPMSYPNVRIANLYGATSPENVDKFMIESEKVVRNVIKKGLDKDIFECAKTHYLAAILRQTETSVGKAMYLSKRLLFYKKASLKESLKKIRSITIDDCNEAAKQVLNNQYHWAVMNPKKG